MVSHEELNVVKLDKQVKSSGGFWQSISAVMKHHLIYTQYPKASFKTDCWLQKTCAFPHSGSVADKNENTLKDRNRERT